MNTTIRLLLAAALAASLVTACKKEEAAPAAAAAPAMSAPKTNDETEWGKYLTDVVQRNLDGAFSTYVYTLPPADAPDFQGYYDRQLEKALSDVQRGGVEGTLLAFGSPSSAKSADLAVASFEKAAPGSMKGVKVIFIGDQADTGRVELAVKPSGATYQFVEAK